MKLLMVLCALLALAGCGGDSNGSSQRAQIPESQIEDIMANQVFACAPLAGDRCPGGIARLFVINPENNEESQLCTGFMIDRDTLITNHHCVSSQVQCDSTFIAIYNGRGPYFSTRCKRFARGEEDFPEGDARKSVDFAVLEVEGLYLGTTFDVTNERVSPGDQISAWVVDHTGVDEGNNLLESRITEFSCQATEQNDTPALILSNCPVIQGNSGSPALNSEGAAIGVIWGATATFNSTLDLELRRDQQAHAAVTEMFNVFP